MLMLCAQAEWTALMYAAHHEHADIVTLLLQRGANPHAVNKVCTVMSHTLKHVLS
jgi:ankyrin repeat protein